MDAYIAEQQNLTDTDNIFGNRLEALSTEWQIFFIVLYSITSVIALAENLLLLFVQLFGNNFDPVLRKCLINLAIADISVGVLSVPFTYTDFMLGRWIFPSFMCPLSQFAHLLSIFVTVYTLTLISIERYIAVVHPILHSQKLNFLRSYSSALLIFGWFLGISVSFVPLINCETVPFNWQNNMYYDCRFTFTDEFAEKVYVVAIFVATFCLPLTLQTMFYCLIALKLRTMHRCSRGVDSVKIIKMLVILVLLFAICWLPIKVFFLVVIFNKEMLDFKTINTYYAYVFTYFIAHYLSMSNSCLNPIVYGFMSSSFREDFWQLFGKMRSKRLNNSSA